MMIINGHCKRRGEISLRKPVTFSQNGISSSWISHHFPWATGKTMACSGEKGFSFSSSSEATFERCGAPGQRWLLLLSPSPKIETEEPIATLRDESPKVTLGGRNMAAEALSPFDRRFRPFCMMMAM